MTFLEILTMLRHKINDLVAAHNNNSNLIDTALGGMQERFDDIADNAATNVGTFTAQIDAKFAEAEADVDAAIAAAEAAHAAAFTALTTTLNGQFIALHDSQEASFATLSDGIAADFSTLSADLAGDTTAAQAAATAAAASAATASAQATAAAEAAEGAAAVTDSAVAGLFNTVGSLSRAAIRGALNAVGVWFGADAENPTAEILPDGSATFTDVHADNATFGGVVTIQPDKLRAGPVKWNGWFNGVDQGNHSGNNLVANNYTSVKPSTELDTTGEWVPTWEGDCMVMPAHAWVKVVFKGTFGNVDTGNRSLGICLNPAGNTIDSNATPSGRVEYTVFPPSSNTAGAMVEWNGEVHAGDRIMFIARTTVATKLLGNSYESRASVSIERYLD